MQFYMKTGMYLRVTKQQSAYKSDVYIVVKSKQNKQTWYMIVDHSCFMFCMSRPEPYLAQKMSYCIDDNDYKSKVHACMHEYYRSKWRLLQSRYLLLSLVL